MVTDLQLLLDEARQGDSGKLGELLAQYERYLTVLAGVEIGRRLQSKVDAADVVQEVFLHAHRKFADFAGETEEQFSAWLRAILATTLAGVFRRYLGTQARDVRLEQQVAERLTQSAVSLSQLLIDPASSPSQHLQRIERGRLVIDALDRLPDDYRLVITLRHMEGLPFPEIAARMGRTLNSVEKLWVRGLGRLKKEFTSLMNDPPE